MADDLQHIRDLFSNDDQEWDAIRSEGTIDMRYVAGDPWEPGERLAREASNRPCLSADEINQYINQVVNNVRANKRAVKFTPIGNGANDKTAQFYQDKMREIEYRSRAQIAYTTAFQNAVERSFGFVRVAARYMSPTAVNQELWIDPVPNPALVTPDPYAVMPDLSDMKRCWIREQWTHHDFNKRWSDHALSASPVTSLIQRAPGWVTDSKVFVGELWEITPRQRKLLIVPGVNQPEDAEPYGVYEEDYDQSQDGVHISERSVDHPLVTQKITNGLEILEENDWPGKYIPLVSCFGKVIYLNQTGRDIRVLMSMVRLARDPQMLYAYLATNEAEVIGGMPRFPYFVYEGQLSKSELQNLTDSVTQPVAVIKVKASIEGLPPGNGPLPFPQRNPYTPPLAEIEVAKESARRMIQAAMAQSGLPTSAQRHNEKSGVALKQIEDQGQRGSFHFQDHYDDMIGQVGRIVEDLMPHVYDTPREVSVRKSNDTTEPVFINGNSDKSISTQGDHLVTVSAGPNFDSEREAGSDFADTIVGSPMLQMLGPEKGPQVLALAIKLKNIGEIGDQIADIVSPPKPKPGVPPTPEQLQAALQQATEKIKQQEQLLQQAAQAQAVDAEKQKASIATAQINAQRDVTVAKMREQTDLQKTHLQILAKTADIAQQGAIDQQLQDDQQRHEQAMAAAEAEHTRVTSEIAHQHGIETMAAQPIEQPNA